MSVEVHIPPNIVITDKNDPMIFLAGPIQGARNWQRDASTLLLNKAPYSETMLHIANPRRDYMDGEFRYDYQVRWEKTQLQRAAENGAILFWFAAQDPKEPYEAGRAYAQTTRIEFGRVLGWLDYNPSIHVSIGIEEGYQGSERYFISCAEEKQLEVHRSLESVCLDALSHVAKEMQ